MFPITVSSPVIILGEIKIFYKMDRDLLSLLTLNLRRDPIESLKVMALWLWLERSGFNNIVQTINLSTQIAMPSSIEPDFSRLNINNFGSRFSVYQGTVTMVPITASSPVITLGEIKIFYKMDRNFFSLLTLNLRRYQIESMRVMALWVWLERFGFTNIVQTISSLLHFLINEIADEAMLCINYLSDSNLFTLFPEPINLPLTQSLLGADVSSNIFHENRAAAILSIGKTLIGVLLRALSDLLQKAIERNTAKALTKTQIPMSSSIEPGFSRLNINNFGSSIRMSFNLRVNKSLGGVVHPDDRTMFVTFSKGYPVPERDIREFFNLIYGDINESLHMQEVHFAEESLYARTVFNTPSVIESVLNGAEKAKFTVKGRHLWMRKFVPKCRSF